MSGAKKRGETRLFDDREIINEEQRQQFFENQKVVAAKVATMAAEQNWTEEETREVLKMLGYEEDGE